MICAQIEGILRLKEIAGNGHTTYKLCSSRVLLWDADTATGSCPTSHRFNINLPATFTDGKDTYVGPMNNFVSLKNANIVLQPLPPTYEVHLSGVPGFRANIDYSITANLFKGKAAALLPVKQR